eukprot:jgi/Mesen1/4004/ME000211S03187
MNASAGAAGFANIPQVQWRGSPSPSDGLGGDGGAEGGADLAHQADLASAAPVSEGRGVRGSVDDGGDDGARGSREGRGAWQVREAGEETMSVQGAGDGEQAIPEVIGEEGEEGERGEDKEERSEEDGAEQGRGRREGGRESGVGGGGGGGGGAREAPAGRDEDGDVADGDGDSWESDWEQATMSATLPGLQEAAAPGNG